ncbi:MAG: ROK family transcriptional regulator, partial [Chloroflexota bacterium]
MIAKKTATDPKIVRQLNKAAILEAVQDRQQGVSRAEVARLTTLSRATVSAIVEDLLAANIVRESGMAASQGGRPPTLLRLNPDAGRVIGVDIGATHLLVVVADLRGNVLAEAESAFEIATGPEACLEQLDGLVHSALKRAACALDGVEAIAVGVPGPVIAEKGMVSAPPIMPGWDGFPIRDRL